MKGDSEKKLQLRGGRYQKLILSSEDSVDVDHNWLITLSDVMSLLLVFFIIIFAMSRVTGGKKETPRVKEVIRPVSAAASVSKPKHDLDDIQKDLKATVSRMSLDDQVSVQAMNQEILITVKENVTFREGDADLLKGSEPLLDRFAEIITRYPAFLVEIDGHTDDLPISTKRFPSNWELSVARATSVLKYLIAKHDLDPARFTIKGNADLRPLSPNWTPAQRAINRRVEIRLKEGHRPTA